MEAYIFDAIRTPRGLGRSSGALHTLSPLDLGSTILRELNNRTNFNHHTIDDVIFGVAENIDDQGTNLARSSILRSGMNERTPGSIISRFCGSGLDAVNYGAMRVASGQADLIVAGGIEMMSLIPIMKSGGAWGVEPEFSNLTKFLPLGVAADLLGTLEGHTRTQVDEYALESQYRAQRAWNNGYFNNSVIPIYDDNGKLLLNRDENVRPETTIDALSSLSPAFSNITNELGYEKIAKQRYTTIDNINHIHTGGNSSGVVDGASALLIGSLKAGRNLGLTPRARITSTAAVACDPCLMLVAPADAARKAAAKGGYSLDQIDLFEVNEAFASVVIRFLSETGISHERVNVNGGSIAMGHPIGATGGILVGTLLDEMERRNLKTGVVTMCVGMGMGVATLIEKFN